MNHPRKTVSLIAFVALVSASPAFTQAPSTEATPEAKAAAPVAYVYVQTTNGVNAYSASTAGQLTLIKGSPFQTVGQIEATNGKYLFSVDPNIVHAYTIQSTGAVGKQAFEINTQSYSGSQCGNTNYYGVPNGSVIDRTGQYLYVQLAGAPYQAGVAACNAWQSYHILPAGTFSFLGSIEYPNGAPGPNSSVPVFSSSDAFAYGTYPGTTTYQFSAYAKAPNGLLTANTHFAETDPKPNPNGQTHFYPGGIAADPNGHLAVAGAFEDPTTGLVDPTQLASYSINETTGAITSTNNWANMPLPGTGGGVLSMSPSGKVLAMGGYPGLEVFHFNDAAPITHYGPLLLPAVDVAQLGWDNNNHLYALSVDFGELYVYTATPAGINEAPGSPYRIDNAGYYPGGLIVVPTR